MYMSPDEFPLPYEYRDFTFDDLVGAPPDDIDERVVMFLDCGNIDRMPVDFLQRDGIHILNIDHHHDNTRFGTVNLVSPEASCTAEIVFGLAAELGAEITPEDRRRPVRRPGHRHRASSCTRTPRPAAHRMAADLIEAGVDAHGVYRRLFEDLPFRRLQLLSRALEKRRPLRRRRDHPRRPHARGLRGDRRARDRLRGHHRPPALGRGHRRSPCWCASCWPTTATGSSKVSLRATDGSVDVSIDRPRARRRRAPPGRRRLHRALARRAGGADPGAGRSAARPDRPGVILFDKPAGVTSHDVVAQVRRDAARRGRRSATPARSTRSPPACCWSSSAAPPAPSGS